MNRISQARAIEREPARSTALLDCAAGIAGGGSQRRWNAMGERQTSKDRALQDRTFLLLLVSISLAFAWILWPYFGAILWASILGILFRPLYRRSRVLNRSR